VILYTYCFVFLVFTVGEKTDIYTIMIYIIIIWMTTNRLDV